MPSVRVSGKTVLVSDAYIDRIGLSKVFGVEKFLSCVNKCFNRNYDEDGEVADVDSAILSEYGVKIFATREVLQLLRDGRILTDITADENFKLVEFLRKHITSHEEIEDLGPVAFCLTTLIDCALRGIYAFHRSLRARMLRQRCPNA